MGSLTKVIILSLSLGVFAQESYASNKADDEVGCSLCEIFKCLFKTTKALAPVALDLAADVTGEAELHDVANITRAAGEAVETTLIKLDVDDADHNGKLDFLAGTKAAADGLSNVLIAAGQGDSTANTVVRKVDGVLSKVAK